VEVDLPPDPYRGMLLRVACPQPRQKTPAKSEEPTPDDPAAVVRAYTKAWEARHGATVQVESYEAQQGPPPGADIWVLAPSELPQWAAPDQLTPVPAALSARDAPYNWSDMLPVWRELLTWDQQRYGMPLLGEALVCCYRSDWFDSADNQRAFRGRFNRKLAPPATWQEFVEIAESFQDQLHAPSLPPLPADDGALDRTFYAVAAPYARRAVPTDEELRPGRVDEVFSFHYDLKTGLPRIATGGFRHALELLQRMQKCRLAGAESVPERAFAEGKAVLCLTNAAWLPFFQKDQNLRDKVGICRVPGAERYYPFDDGPARSVAEPNRVPYLGGTGWLAAVPKDAAHPQAAFAMLAELTGPAESMQISLKPIWGGGPIRDAQLRRERWDSYDLDGPQTAKLREALQEELRHRALKNPVVCLRIPEEGTHRTVLDAALRKALETGTEPRTVLREVATRWQELDRQRGPAFRNEYRLSLGLRPER
jgi:multiple sugar transport system substrate-binding protein